jgi:RodZ C-terminal domain
MLEKIAARNARRQEPAPRSARRRPRLRTAAILTAAALALVAVALAVAFRPRSSGHSAGRTQAVLPTVTRPASPRPKRKATTSAPARPQAARLRVTASRGRCWLIARQGDAQGRALYSGVVELGSTIEVRARRIWARFGAIGYVDLTLNGRPLHVGRTGTVDVVVTAAGVRG